jgi:hypothetical protein
MMIAERVQQEKAQQEAVLQRSVKLLKTYLPKHPPSADVLNKLDQFCSTVNTTNETTSKVILPREHISPMEGLEEGNRKIPGRFMIIDDHLSITADFLFRSSFYFPLVCFVYSGFDYQIPRSVFEANGRDTSRAKGSSTGRKQKRERDTIWRIEIEREIER